MGFDVIFDYFIKYYIQFSLPSMPITELVLLVCMAITFNDENKLRKKPWLILHLFVIWALLIVVKALLRSEFNTTYIYIIFLVPYALLCGRHRILNTILQFLTIWTAYVFGTTFSKATAHVVCDLLGIACTEYITYFFLAVVLSGLIIAFTVMMKKLPIKKDGKYLLGHIMIPVVVCIAANIAKIIIDGIKEEGLPFFGVAESESSVFIFFIGILIYLLNALAYYMCYSFSQTVAKNEEIDSTISSIKRKYSLHNNDTEMIHQNLEEMRRIRHDIKNQLAYIQIMISQKDYGRLEEYFNEFSKEIAEPLDSCDCDNATIRNALQLERFKAKQSGISIDAKIVAPTEIRILDSDLASLIINLLDNAIEAVEEDEINNAEIEVNIRVNGDFFYIKVTNPIENKNKLDRRRALATGKANTALHGRGTKIISSIADKYSGSFRHEANENSFSAEVMLIQS